MTRVVYLERSVMPADSFSDVFDVDTYNFTVVL